MSKFALSVEAPKYASLVLNTEMSKFALSVEAPKYASQSTNIIIQLKQIVTLSKHMLFFFISDSHKDTKSIQWYN